jgi:hypothetical protein
VIDLAGAARSPAPRGLPRVAAGDAFLDRLVDEGLRLRRHRVPPGGSVACTVAPEDDVMVAPFEPPARSRLVLCDAGGREVVRLPDAAADSSRGEVVLTEPIDPLRELGAATARVRLVAVEERGERILGEDTFNHAPHPRR